MRSSPISRRRFMVGGSAALVAALHGEPGWGLGSSTTDRAKILTGDAPRLLDLRLACATPLAEMTAFYRDLLGFSVLASSEGEITLAAGGTRLTFFTAPRPTGAAHDPFYHFAFNIPKNKILGARSWHLERGRLIRPYEHLLDPGMPNDVVHFRNWDAHSLFFWDPAGNLVEYIARHTLDNAKPGEFTAADILYASEIAFVVDDVKPTARKLQSTFQLEQYRQSYDTFTALGDERGLVLVMQRGRPWGFTEAKPASVYPTHAQIRAVPEQETKLTGFPHTLVSR